jgi:hypothetical protein
MSTEHNQRVVDQLKASGADLVKTLNLAPRLTAMRKLCDTTVIVVEATGVISGELHTIGVEIVPFCGTNPDGLAMLIKDGIRDVFLRWVQAQVQAGLGPDEVFRPGDVNTWFKAVHIP